MSFLSGCPTGVVFAFAGPTAPDGWLLCDGTPVSRTTYATLFATIGTAHGSGDGSTTFHLPDYRGRMLRGRDGGVARDPDRASRTAANAGGNTGDNVGSVQAQATAKNGLTASVSGTNGTSSVSGSTSSDGNHFHTPSAGGNFVTEGVGGFAWVGSLNSFNRDTQTNTTGAHTHTISGTAAAQSWSGSVTVGAGDAETRPINAYVNYIIKI